MSEEQTEKAGEKAVFEYDPGADHILCVIAESFEEATKIVSKDTTALEQFFPEITLNKSKDKVDYHDVLSTWRENNYGTIEPKMKGEVAMFDKGRPPRLKALYHGVYTMIDNADVQCTHCGEYGIVATKKNVIKDDDEYKYVCDDCTPHKT